MKYEKIAEVHNALSDPTRVKILWYLFNHNCSCICHLIKNIKKDQSVIFRHIELLEKVGLIKTKKEGKFLMCCIRDKEKVKRMLEV